MTVLVETGLDVLCRENFRSLAGARIGLLANQSAVNSRLEHAADLLNAASNFEMVKLLAPEHGFRGELQDMATVDHSIDTRTGLPVISLYGRGAASLRPTKDDLSGIDILLVDLPDIGSRYYTFAQSLIYTMQTAAETGTKVVVLDRPNPLGGAEVEGAELLASCRSFCGYAPVANRHGLTLGEIALLANNGFGEGENSIPAIRCDLQIVKLNGWRREMYFDHTGLPWIIPSVNMPTLDTAIVYPGSCLFEATTVSEGRGTTRPFEFIGAPFINGAAWAKATMELKLDLAGAILRPHSFIPKFQKCANQSCGGIQIHVTCRETFQPFRWCLALIYSLAKLYPDNFSWRSDAYEFIKDTPAIDLLYGSSKFRKVVEGQGTLANLFDELKTFEQDYLKQRKDFLLYR